MKQGLLNWYWADFGGLPPYSNLSKGAGLTAFSEEDAIGILKQTFETTVVGIRKLSSLRDITDAHIVPNMGNQMLRGIWFPKGYETL